MAMLFSAALGLLLLASAAGAKTLEGVTPVEKVITLLEDLKAEVESEGQAEAGTYDTFACFCKDTTKSKSTAITSGRDDIDTYTADIGAKTATKNDKVTELGERKAKQEELTQELQETEARCAKAQAEYEAAAADLSKAISSLDAAVKAMEDSKPGAAGLLQVQSSVEQSLALADVMGLIAAPRREAVSAFLQTAVDPADPTYAYHSQTIIDTLTKLLTDFRAEKGELDAEWAKTKANCEATILSLNGKLDSNSNAMGTLSSEIETLKGEIAQARENLINAEAMLKDDQTYLKDLTERCETRANDWDQRSQMRADELQALSSALALLKTNISGLDVAVNERALLQERGASSGQAASQSRRHLAPSKEAVLAGVSAHVASPALLQLASAAAAAARESGAARGLLRGGQAAAAFAQARKDRAVALLNKEGQRLGSSTLSGLAAHLADDPFTKVKVLIQELIERLLRESTSEATKKGFCDEELGKAYKDRDHRMADTQKLDMEVQGLEIKEIELVEEIDMLTGALATLRDDLNETTVLREQEHEENLETIKKAKEGFAAVSQAIDILKVFYKNAAKATVLVQISPVDEDTDGAGFAGAYRGKQTRSKGVLGMLEVIKSDFDRTARTTEAAEAKAHAEFVEFDRASRADISGKETKKALDEEDLETTRNRIASKMSDLKTAQNLLDGALKSVEALKPMCIDTGMSYEDRVQKREEEIQALKSAVCILDTDSVEPDC